MCTCAYLFPTTGKPMSMLTLSHSAVFPTTLSASRCTQHPTSCTLRHEVHANTYRRCVQMEGSGPPLSCIQIFKQIRGFSWGGSPGPPHFSKLYPPHRAAAHAPGRTCYADAFSCKSMLSISRLAVMVTCEL